MYHSHGSGDFKKEDYKELGDNVIFEKGVLVFHPENISIGDNVYVGHNAILKGYYKNEMKIGSGVWIGQQCFFHSAGGINIGNNVGIGPGVTIITSYHKDPGKGRSIMEGEIQLLPVVIGDNSDIGVGAIILPGVSLGEGVQIGAGAVVTKNVDPYQVAVGNPARVVKERGK